MVGLITRLALLLEDHRPEGVDVRRPKGLQPEDVREAARLYESGWLLREIAKKFGVSQ